MKSADFIVHLSSLLDIIDNCGILEQHTGVIISSTTIPAVHYIKVNAHTVVNYI